MLLPPLHELGMLLLLAVEVVVLLHLMFLQTLELIQQERVGLSAKLSERRAYYCKVAEDMSAKFQKQQEWIRHNKISRELNVHELVKENVDEQKSKAEGRAGADGSLIMDNLESEARNKKLITELDSAKARLDEILNLKSKILAENKKVKLAIEDVKCRADEFKPELKAPEITALEEEYNALLSDKAGEAEYLQSLEKQVAKLKICRVVKCACGEEFTVAVNM